jgi:transaldolase
VPVNVTLLFTAGQYAAAAEAYLRAIERRIDAGLDPVVSSVASVFVSRWDSAVAGRLPEGLDGKLALAASGETYAAYRRVLASDRWQRLENEGARPQRLLWASTGTKDARMPDTRYVTDLAAPNTVNTMPEATLLAFADHGTVGDLLPPDGGDSAAILAAIREAGVDVEVLGRQLQDDGATSFVASWEQLVACIASKAATTAPAR